MQLNIKQGGFEICHTIDSVNFKDSLCLNITISEKVWDKLLIVQGWKRNYKE